MALSLVGCIDGDLSARDDGKQAAHMRVQRDSGLRETRVNEAAQRLMRDNPGMSPKEAHQRAEASIPKDPPTPAPSAGSK